MSAFKLSLCPGLFSRAIAQSGCALNQWAFHTTSAARRTAFRFGEALGCTTNDSQELIEFLSTIPAQQLVEGVSEAMTEEVWEETRLM
jgi:carboxylesterase type B